MTTGGSPYGSRQSYGPQHKLSSRQLSRSLLNAWIATFFKENLCPELTR